jgi:hypothetical protein
MNISKSHLVIYFVMFIACAISCNKNEEDIQKNNSVPSVETIYATTASYCQAGLKGKITNKGGSEIIKQGFCYSKTPNPTIEQSSTILATNTTSLDIELQPKIFSEATTYYIKAFAVNSDGVGYGQELTFKTHGWIGPGGGVVFYDKGYYSNGWRYIEAATKTIPDKTIWVQWGSTGLLVKGASSDSMGSGYENTKDMISANLKKDPGSALLMNDLIMNYSNNGFTDWYIPSVRECEIALRNIRFTNNNLPEIYRQGGFSTSVQINSLEYYCYDQIIGKVASKKDRGLYIWPMRRF